jgi:DNA repair protein RadC
MSGTTSYDEIMDDFSNKPDVRERLIQTSPRHVSDPDLLAAILGSGSRGRPSGNWPTKFST